MKTNLLWTGRAYNSLENCLLTSTDTGVEVNSIIVGVHNQRIYRVEYVIKTNQAWETLACEVKSQLDGKYESINLQSDGNGNWIVNGTPAEQLSGCTEVDISLTPLTNTLPINRLKLATNETQLIQVVYIDLLGKQVQSVRQRYTKRSQTQYHYENVPNDFEAVITVDDLGLVVDYPDLFVRTAFQNTTY